MTRSLQKNSMDYNDIISHSGLKAGYKNILPLNTTPLQTQKKESKLFMARKSPHKLNSILQNLSHSLTLSI